MKMTIVYLVMLVGLVNGALAQDTIRAAAEGPSDGPEQSTQTTDSIYSCEPGTAAQFKGGENAFREFVFNKFEYPRRCQEMGISGSVLIRFVVEKDGRLSNITVIEQSAKCPEFAAEALRVMRSSPRWIPGMANGVYVRSYRELPIKMSVE